MHNDLKADQIALEVNEIGEVKATLLDLGKMTRIGERPYAFNYTEVDALMMAREDVRRRDHYHLSPEAFHGRAVDAANDVYSLAVMVKRILKDLPLSCPALEEVLHQATHNRP